MTVTELIDELQGWIKAGDLKSDAQVLLVTEPQNIEDGDEMQISGTEAVVQDGSRVWFTVV